MSPIWMVILAACGSPATATPPPAGAGWNHFGGDFTVAAAVPASAVLDAPADHLGHPVRVTGELTEVCQKMGCWAVVADDAGHQIRVTMKDHAFGIDKDGAGRTCDVEGELVKKAVDPEQLAHYAAEGSAHPPEQGKSEVFELVASAVSVQQKVR